MIHVMVSFIRTEYFDKDDDDDDGNDTLRVYSTRNKTYPTSTRLTFIH